MEAQAPESAVINCSCATAKGQAGRPPDWKERIKGLLQDDDRVIVAALATCLNFSLRGSILPFAPTKALSGLVVWSQR